MEFSGGIQRQEFILYQQTIHNSLTCRRTGALILDCMVELSVSVCNYYFYRGTAASSLILLEELLEDCGGILLLVSYLYLFHYLYF